MGRFANRPYSAAGPGTRWFTQTKENFGDARFVEQKDGFPFMVENGILRIEAAKKNGVWCAGIIASVDPNWHHYEEYSTLRFGDRRAGDPPGGIRSITRPALGTSPPTFSRAWLDPATSRTAALPSICSSFQRSAFSQSSPFGASSEAKMASVSAAAAQERANANIVHAIAILMRLLPRSCRQPIGSGHFPASARVRMSAVLRSSRSA